VPPPQIVITVTQLDASHKIYMVAGGLVDVRQTFGAGLALVDDAGALLPMNELGHTLEPVVHMALYSLVHT
jgi:hypothetical protein